MQSTWDADSLGNERNGPSLSTVLPDADIIRSTGETRLQCKTLQWLEHQKDLS